MHLLQQAIIYITIATGFLLFILGIALLVLPGPGWLVIIVGLSMLAGHFIWARRILREVRRDIGRGKQWVKKELR